MWGCSRELGENVQYFVGYKVLLFSVSHFLGERFILNVTLPIYFIFFSFVLMNSCRMFAFGKQKMKY